MTRVTIRRVEEAWVEKAKLEASRRQVSMNTVFVEALQKGLQVDAGPITNGLERFAGDSDFGSGWDARLQELGEVNPEDWK